MEAFRARDILSYSSGDNPVILPLFNQFLVALQLCEGTKKGTGSPVAVAKALHLLAPRYFPLWDLEIAKAYGCRYSERPAEKYVLFTNKTKHLAEQLVAGVQTADTSKSLLKLIDEYNYVRYTKGWI